MVSSQTSSLFSRVFHKGVSLVHSLPLTINFSYLFLFADDTKCLSPIHSPTESLNLQRDLQAMVHGVTNGAWLPMNPSVLTSVSSPTQTLYILHTTLKTFLSPFLIPIKILESSCLVISPGMTIIVSLLQEHTNLLVSLEEPLPPILYLQKGSYFFPLFVLNYHTVIIWRPHLSKHIVVLEKVQKRAAKFILNDYSLNYKNRLIAIHLLPLMYQLELNDLMFFIQSLKHPADHFNIKHFVSFSQSNTRSSTHNKLIHTKSPSNPPGISILIGFLVFGTRFLQLT